MYRPHRQPAARVADVRDDPHSDPRCAERHRPSLPPVRVRRRGSTTDIPRSSDRVGSSDSTRHALGSAPGPVSAGLHRRRRRQCRSGLCDRHQRDPGRPEEDPGRGARPGSCRGRPRAESRRRIRYPTPGLRLPAGHRSGRVAIHTRLPVCIRTGMGGRDAVRAARQLAVPCTSPQRLGSQKYTEDFNEVKRLGGDGVTTPSERTAEGNGDRTLLGRGLAPPVESNRPSGRHGQGSRLVGERAAVRPAQYGSGRWLHRLVRGQVPGVQLLAPRHRDSAGGDGRQPEHDRRRDMDASCPDSPYPRPRLGTQCRGRCGGASPAKFSYRPHSLRDLQPALLPGSTCRDSSPVIRRYASFSDAADENGLSRILVGFPFRKAVDDGIEHGRKIGNRAVNRFMRPVGH